jgi:hypothetical protein
MEAEKIENAVFTSVLPKAEEKEKAKEYEDLIQKEQKTQQTELIKAEEKEKAKELKQTINESKKLKLSFVLGFAWVFMDNIFKKWNTEPLTFQEKEAQADGFNIVLSKYMPNIIKYVDEINLFDAIATPVIKRFGNRKQNIKSDAINELEKTIKK